MHSVRTVSTAASGRGSAVYAHTGADDCPFLETVAFLRPRGGDVRGDKDVRTLPTAAKRQQGAQYFPVLRTRNQQLAQFLPSGTPAETQTDVRRRNRHHGIDVATRDGSEEFAPERNKVRPPRRFVAVRKRRARGWRRSIAARRLS